MGERVIYIELKRIHQANKHRGVTVLDGIRALQTLIKDLDSAHQGMLKP